jgi:DNA topoisomerase-1
MSLIIVESPTKARTFNRIFKIQNVKHFVFATFGHIRDLPKSKIAIDYQKNFMPEYEIISSKKKVVNQLKKLAKENDEVILATDLDREGEAIAYHVAYLLGFAKENWPEIKLNEKKPIKRIIFHEITAQAINEALKNPQKLRLDLVQAQQARRILDRIVGYELSPLLWKIMGKKWLSAGRVQTVALRLIVEREKEIRQFKVEPYFQIYGQFLADKNLEIKGKLIKKDDLAYENTYKIKLFDGEYQYVKTTIDKPLSEKIILDLKNDKFQVSNIKQEINPRFPPPPFTTSLLQQDAFHQFHFSSKMTMKLAQDLYEQGLITYHRTDSFNLASQFVFKAKDYIIEKFGKEYALEKPRGFKTKSRNAQEAHEAIRPTNLKEEISLEKITDKLTANHKKLYQLIFKRAVATQMKEASVKSIKVEISSEKKYLFESEFFQVIFPGFLQILNPDYVKNHQQPLNLEEKTPLVLKDSLAQQIETKPPYRYNDASLIKSLEEKGIGRPSTYAPILSLILDKNYVEKQNRYFLPTKLGKAISDYLCQSFPQIFDLSFTAQMEEGLDLIADGQKKITDLLNEFYQPFIQVLEVKKKEKKVIDVEEVSEEKCPLCQHPLVVRYSKYGKFLACSQYPSCKFTKPFLKYVNGKFCPLCHGRLTIRFTKTKKRFYGCENYPKCKYSTWKL